MASIIAERRYTPDELLKLPDGDRFELVAGQLVETEMSLLASFIAGRLIELLSAFVRAGELGGVFSSDASYQCFTKDPERIRRPDVSFIQRSRLKPEFFSGHVPIAPDLAVEVVSPNDLYYDVQNKVEEYLAAGVRLVWVLNPDKKIVQVYRPDRSVSHLQISAELSGESVLPGFACGVVDLFKLPPTQA